jgi:hypothetical protein
MAMPMTKQVFGVQKPIVGMMHVLDGQNFDDKSKRALSDHGSYRRGKADGLLFENWGSECTNRLASEKTKRYMEDVVKWLREIEGSISLPFGFNILPLDYEAAFLLAQKTGARFVQIDTFVDKVITDYSNTFMLYIEPGEVIRLRRELGLIGVKLFTNIQTKHYITVPKGKRLVDSARQAVEERSDALVVTGRVTGEKTPIDRILRAKKVAGNVPVFIGSGFDAKNAKELLPKADGAIVGTSLKEGGITENPVSEQRVRGLMEVVRALRE